MSTMLKGVLVHNHNMQLDTNGMMEVKWKNCEKKSIFRKMRSRKPPPICDSCTMSGNIWRRCIKHIKDLHQGKFISKSNLIVDRKLDRFKGNWVVKREVKSPATHLLLKAKTPCSCTLTVVVHNLSQATKNSLTEYINHVLKRTLLA